MDFQQLSYNDHSLFHMLRHFEQINDSAKACLLERGYRIKAIEENLKMVGSKFHPSFATDIKTLIANCEGMIPMQIKLRDKYEEYTFIFKKDNYPNGIGSMALVSLEQANNLTYATIVKKENRGLKLNHLMVEEIPNEWQLTMILRPQKNYHFLITAFPGFATLPFPKNGMDPDFYLQCANFWNGHAFLERKVG